MKKSCEIGRYFGIDYRLSHDRYCNWLACDYKYRRRLGWFLETLENNHYEYQGVFHTKKEAMLYIAKLSLSN